MTLFLFTCQHSQRSVTIKSEIILAYYGECHVCHNDYAWMDEKVIRLNLISFEYFKFLNSELLKLSVVRMFQVFIFKEYFDKKGFIYTFMECISLYTIVDLYNNIIWIFIGIY